MENLSEAEQATVDSYNRNAEHWSSLHSTPGGSFLEMRTLRTELPKGAKILDIGSGSGRHARELTSLGFDYTGIDISEGLLEEARKRNPDAKFLKMSMYDLDFLPDTFDGFWAIASLLHIPKARIDEVLQGIRRVVKTDGIGIIKVKSGEGEELKREESAAGHIYDRFFSYYTPEEIEKVLRRNGFDLVRFDPQYADGTTWLTYRVKKK